MNIEVKVIAGARRREIRFEGSRLKVKLLAKPIHGKANDELVELLAAMLGVKRRDIRILAGERDARKVVFVPVDEERIREAVCRAEDCSPISSA